jgi:hypothetical protein
MIGLVLTILALLSLAHPGQVLWYPARAICLVLLAWEARRHPHRLLPALAVGFGAVALCGPTGLDFAVAALGFALARTPLRTLAWAIGGIGILGAVGLVVHQISSLQLATMFPFGNRNHYAVFCEMGLPVLVYTARRTRQPAWYAIAGVMLLAALAGGSRTGAVLLLVECVAIWAAVEGRERLWQPAGIAVAIGVAFLALSSPDRISSPLKGDHRLEIWQSSVRMVSAKPLTGWGGQQFSRIYPEYASFDNGQLVNFAHNDWLEWAVEYGVWFPVMLLAALAWWGEKNIHFYPSWGILMGALHASVDFPFHLPGLLFFAAALAGSIKTNGIHAQAQSANRQRRNP